MSLLPQRHTPRELREGPPHQRQATYYAAGVRGRDGKFFPFYAMTTDLEGVLDDVPVVKTRAVLMRFNQDGTNDVLYRWRTGAWHLVKPRKPPARKKPRKRA